MKCPVCKEPDLVMTDRQGVEIDYCPTCRGVWLDRGELEKIIERASIVEASGRDTYASYPQYGHLDARDHDDDHHRGGFFGGGRSDQHRRRKSWLGELFD
jgi:uncharacterized protein